MEFQPIDTVMSIHIEIDLPAIRKAKEYMNENTGNQYSLIIPHLSFLLLPIPPETSNEAQMVLTSYIEQLSSFQIQLGDIIMQKDNNFGACIVILII